MSVCAHCGRENDDASRFCKDCGKPVAGSGSAGSRPAMAPVGQATPRGSGATACPSCRSPVTPGLPYCPTCGARLVPESSGPSCATCHAPLAPGNRFCAACGAPVETTTADSKTRAFSPKQLGIPITLVVIDEAGTVLGRHQLMREETTLGRGEADIAFADDPFLSPLHAQLSFREGQLFLRDLGSRNSTWSFIEEAYRLVDGDLLLIGSQILRFRRLGYPGPHPPERDATRRMGSLVPSADIARLTQLRGDGSDRDVCHLSPGRHITIGRERGDWLFPYDPSMSGTHAQVRSEDADFVIVDCGSRNGVAIAVRGEVQLRKGSRLLVGDKLMRVEMP